MAIEYRRTSTNDTPNEAANRLRTLLRRRLHVHLDTNSFRPALTVIGFRGTTADVVDQEVGRPAAAMLGLTLPARYSAIGVVASSVVATPPTPHHEDAALAVGVDRRGAVVSLLATTSRGVIETRTPHGWLIDACHRAVGLATEPCSTAALSFPIALWLDRLMVAILNGPAADPITWADAVDLCPVPDRWRSHDPSDLGTTLGSTTRSWPALRQAAIVAEYAPVGVTPDQAQWMDDAMFARWCLGSFPDLANLRADVEFLAPPDVANRVERTLRAAWLAFAE